MKIIILLATIAFGSIAHAQFSVQETFNDSGYTYSFFSVASTEMDQTEADNTEHGTGRFSTYNYLTVGTWLTYDLSGGMRLPFSYSTAGRDRFNDGEVQSQELLLQDIILYLKDSHLALLPFDIGVYWEGRVYLPTGKYSRERDQIGALRNHFVFDKILTKKTELEYSQDVTYFHQGRTAYKASFYDDRGELVELASVTKAWELEHRFSYWYKFNGDTGAGIQTRYEDTYFNFSPENSRTGDRSNPLKKRAQHLVAVGPAVKFALSSRANFILTYSDVVLATDNMNELGQFKPENAEIALLSFVRF